MDVMLDGCNSPRRGSLNSLHRQPSGSFSHGNKLSSPGGGLQSETSNGSSSSLHSNLEKYTRYFIIKSVQVIVQSRIGSGRRIKADCKPGGNDWFNINITDIPEISDRTKAAIDTENFTLKSNWRVCCEISLRTSDGGRVVLEHWVISNRGLLGSSHRHLPSKLSQTSPKGYQNDRSSPVSSPTNNNGASLVGPVNSVSPTARARHATFSNTMRTRLSSIDDCSSDSDYKASKSHSAANNENFDIKSSTSCFSLSNATSNQTSDQHLITTTSANSNNLGLSPGMTAASKTIAMSSIYTIYNRMSLLLKTLMTTVHVVPTHRLACEASQSDSPCVICYRVYTSPSPYSSSKQNSPVGRGSIEEIAAPDSPGKRSSASNLSFGAVNIRDYVPPDELEHFCPLTKLGSIRTELNELDVSVCYRTDANNSNNPFMGQCTKGLYNRILDEDCITAAKQLLAGNDCTTHDCHNDDDSDSFQKLDTQELYNGTPICIDQPLRPAFSAHEQNADKSSHDPNLTIIESAFDRLLTNRASDNQEGLIKISPDLVKKSDKLASKNTINGCTAHSEPIQVPSSPYRSKQTELYPNLSNGSTPKSLTDSFVFVDINPPFASEEQNDINSFFHGPSPAFSNGFDGLKDVDELTSQLAVIEANASQIDDFVDTICVSENEEES